MSDVTAKEVLQARSGFYTGLLICVGGIVLIHLLPKNPAPRDDLRLFYTVTYFGAWISLCFHMTGPRAKYMELYYRWSYQDSPESIEKGWQAYLHSLNEFMGLAMKLTILFLVSTAYSVLDNWFPALRVLSTVNNFVWWGTAIALLCYCVAGAYMLEEAFQRYRQLRLQVAQDDGFDPRGFMELYDGARQSEREPSMIVTGEMEFQAGGQTWYWEDFYQNCLIIGQTGSGKTLCVLHALLEGLLASSYQSLFRPGGLILDPKGDLQHKLPILAQKHDRVRDLLTIDPANSSGSLYWNPLDTEEDALELASRFVTVMQSLSNREEDSAFQINSARKFIHHAITLLRLTNPPDQPPGLFQISQLVNSPEERQARTQRVSLNQPEAEACLSFFTEEWRSYPNEMRSSVQAQVSNLVEPFTVEPFRSVFGTRSSIRVGEAVQRGKILHLHMPVAKHPVMAVVVGCLLKLEYYQEILRRPDKERPSFFLCDEFQVFLSTHHGTGDADFFERSRQSRHANLIATQNIPSLRKQTKRQEPVDNLLAHFATRIFLRNNDPETNTWAARTFGEHLELMGSVSGSQRTAGQSTGVGGALSVGGNQQRTWRLPPEKFSELAIPSEARGQDYCEAYTHRASQPTMDRKNLKRQWPLHPIE